MTQPDTAVPQERFRLVTWPVWFAWVLLAAIGPVVSSAGATLMNASFPANAPYAKFLPTLTLFSLFAAWLTPPAAQGLILKRIVPKLSIGFWVLCIALTGIAWYFLQSDVHGHGPQAEAFRASLQFRHAALTARLAGTLQAQMFALPWGSLLIWSAVGNGAMALLPAWIIGFSTGRTRDGYAVFTAAIVAGCVATVVEQLYDVYGAMRPLNESALNNMSWPGIFEIVAARAGVGAIWGAMSGLVFIALTRRQPTPATWMPQRSIGIVVMAATCVAIAFLTPFAGYLAGPRGLRVGAPALWKALSFAPAADRSQGENVLADSHDIAVPLGNVLSIAISPDSTTAIVRSDKHRLVRVDLATGRAIAPITEALLPLERHAVLFRPDGKFLAVVSHGDEVAISHYKKYQNRVRLYALPGFNQVGEFVNHEGQCFDSVAREPMLFEPDGNSLWLACAQYTTSKADDLMAIKLEVPSLKQLDVRRYGDTAASGTIRGLESVGDSVWAWQFPFTTAVPFRIHDLSHDREILRLSIPTEPTANLTAQTGQSRIDDKTVKLNFCGVHSTAPDAAKHFDRAASLCRFLAFDTKTGALIEQTDRSDSRFAPVPSALLLGHGLRIEATWQPTSKTGEIIVRDAATGRERQRIVSVAQRPIQFSPDGRWLVTHAIDRKAFRVYRVKR